MMNLAHRILWGKGKWPDVAVGAQYPAALNQQIYQHMKYVEKEEHVVTLARSAWAGSQRWGTAVWSGDTAATVRKTMDVEFKTRNCVSKTHKNEKFCIKKHTQKRRVLQ